MVKWQYSWMAALTAVITLFISTSKPALATDNAMDKFTHFRSSDSIGSFITHPAFLGFGQHLLPRDSDVSSRNLPLSHIQSLLPYHGYVDTKTVLNAINHMVDDASAGKTIFYDFYTDQQRADEISKNSTGLFFFRGKPGSPFAVICPGGGFSYVGSVHEGFPHALELSKHGYNAFVLRYRIGGGGTPATQDLAAALSYIFKNANVLEVGTTGYSLWGSSAGARMVAGVASHGVAGFGGDTLPDPAVIVMAYTDHSDFSVNYPPTFVIVSNNDPIVNVATVENRVHNMQKIGIDVEYHNVASAGHGFGLGVGTDAEGWIEYAIRFWKKHIPK